MIKFCANFEYKEYTVFYLFIHKYLFLYTRASFASYFTVLVNNISLLLCQKNLCAQDWRVMTIIVIKVCELILFENAECTNVFANQLTKT